MLQKKKTFIKIFFSIDIIGIIAILCCIAFTRTNVHNIFSRNAYQDISKEWYLDERLTTPVTIEQLGKYMDPDTGVISVYSQIPDITMDTYIVYRTKDVFSRVLVNDTLLYETDTPKSPYYNKSPGNIWNNAVIPSKYANNIIQIEITMVYDTNAITLDHTFLGSETDIILELINQKSFALLISIFLFITGFLFIFINIAIMIAQPKTSASLFYLGIYAVFIGIWSMMETNVIQFFVQDARVLQFTDNMAMVVGNIPLFLYLDTSHGILDIRISRILCYINLIYILICIILQFTPGYDVHSVIFGASVFILIFTIVYIGFFIHEAFIMFRKKQKVPLEVRLQILGIVILMITASAQTIHYEYLNTDGMDRAESVRLAMMLMIIIWGISSQLQMIRLIEQGMHYNIVSQMAYTDILTNLENRTAYLEKLHALESDKSTFGIVYLDINNLKIVNDTYGHENGDILIRMAADVIQNSFGLYGSSYRIGGDEFCVLIVNDKCQHIYNEALPKFEQKIAEKNKTSPKHLYLQIAHGFSICHDADTIAESISDADTAMYANKKLLKSNHLEQ